MATDEIDDNVVELELNADQIKGLDAVDFEGEDPNTVIGTPDPKKSKREKASPKAPKPAKKTAPPYRAGKFVKPIQELYTYAALGIAPFDPMCAKALLASAENCAEAWDSAAKENTAIRRALQSLVEGTTYSKLIAAHLPIALAVLSHHKPGMVPEMFRINPENGEVNASDERAA